MVWQYMLAAVVSPSIGVTALCELELSIRWRRSIGQFFRKNLRAADLLSDLQRNIYMPLMTRCSRAIA